MDARTAALARTHTLGPRIGPTCQSRCMNSLQWQLTAANQANQACMIKSFFGLYGSRVVLRLEVETRRGIGPEVRAWTIYWDQGSGLQLVTILGNGPGGYAAENGWKHVALLD